MATADVIKPDYGSQRRHFIFTEEHDLLRESIRRFAVNELQPHAEEWEETTFPDSVFRRMGELGLVEHIPYRGVTLTEAGRRVALEVIRHHRLLELYLVKSLGVPWDRVHAEAEVLEHVLSEELEELISAKLGDPTHDPHGDPIPTRDLEIIEGETQALEQMDCGARGTFVRISDSDPEMLRYLAERGIAPGENFEVVDRQPFGGPLFVRFGDGADAHPLGGELARAMRVQVVAATRASAEVVR